MSTKYDSSQGNCQMSLPPHKVPVTQAFSHNHRIWISALINKNPPPSHPTQTFQEFFKQRHSRDMARWLQDLTFHISPEFSKLWNISVLQVFIASSANRLEAAFHWTIGGDSKVVTQGQGSEKKLFHYWGLCWRPQRH